MKKDALYVNTSVRFIYCCYVGQRESKHALNFSHKTSKIVQVSSPNPGGTMASKMKVPSGSRCEVTANSSLVLVESLKL